MADDLGYGELGAYGQTKIETPNIDDLARNGMTFRQYYSGSPVCAPSRCILLSGTHSGHAYIRGNDEMRERGAVWDYIEMAKNPYLEGQRPMADSIVTVAEKLKDSGYATAFFGKWGLGYPGSESTPNKQGFDYFYGYNCQRQAHTLTPLHLWRNEDKDHLANDTLPPRTKLDEGADPYDWESYTKYFQPDYAPQKIFDELMSHIDGMDGGPFCIFWESPIPHLPLQAPKEWIDRYVEKFGEEEPYTGDKGYFPARYPRATYAAMVSYLDYHIGQVLDKLSQKGLRENTVVFFTSDNGPSYTGGTDSPWFDSGAPFEATYGWGKGFLREGGIRVPMIVNWPNRIRGGTRTDHITAAQDVFPTLCELAGISTSGDYLDGISFVPTLLEKENQESHPYLYWEFPEYGGQVAIRKGPLKAFAGDLHNSGITWEIYNLEDDPQEQNNISDSQPAFLTELDRIIQREHDPSFNPRWQIASLDSISHE